MTDATATKRARLLPMVGLVTGLILIGLAAWLWGKQLIATHRPAQLPNPKQTITADTAQPLESAPRDSAGYEVPANQPRSIQVERVGINGLIQRVGATHQNTIAVPTNINFGGWYVSSVAPGEPGLSIIDGHVTGRYGNGVFKNLGKLIPGDVVAVEMGDHTRKRFQVESVQQMDTKSAGPYLFTKKPGIKSQLNLITCGGSFNKGSQQYDQRVVVVTKLFSGS